MDINSNIDEPSDELIYHQVLDNIFEAHAFSNDSWFLSETDESKIIVSVDNRFYLWEDGHDLVELVRSPLKSI